LLMLPSRPTLSGFVFCSCLLLVVFLIIALTGNSIPPVHYSTARA
jgi:hypothetical protein